MSEFTAVPSFPKVIYFDGKQIVNPSAEMCLRAGYRLVPPLPAAPDGKVAGKTKLALDEKDPTKLKWVVEYVDAPPPPPLPKEEILTADEVEFVFLDGAFAEARKRGAV